MERMRNIMNFDRPFNQLATTTCLLGIYGVSLTQLFIGHTNQEMKSDIACLKCLVLGATLACLAALAVRTARANFWVTIVKHFIGCGSF